ncbi:helix-turn-helix domain-containing protein [Castellaniella daejeonensis]|jgi:AraC family ethanolamine operon transcriptional activator|uniref:Helix-turn-helix domain-containing protein n=1 Tax=Castellaniella daejeonensis TaxID=659013 RepID=A0ABN0TB42_9BURK
MPRKSRTVLPAAVTSDIISKVVSTMVTSFAYDTPPSQPAIRRRTRTARDADDHARNLSQWEQSYDQFSSGDFQGRLTELWLPRLQLFQESANQALRQSCAAWRDSLWFGLPAPHQQVSRLDALPIPDHTLLFRPGARQFELNTPQDYNIFGIVLDQDLLREHLTPQDEDISDMLGEGGTLTIEPVLYQRMTQTLGHALFEPLPAGGATAEALQETVLDLLWTAIAQGSRPDPDPHYSRIRHSRQIVQQARELVLAQASHRLSIADICRQLHISRRTLQYSFQTAVGLSPLAYLRILKLNQVRRRLRNAQDFSGRVTQAATTWGFEHLGQFSQDYRHLFGECPSATLKHIPTHG